MTHATAQTEPEAACPTPIGNYFDLARIGRIVWRRKSLLALGLILGLALGWLYCRHCTPVYRAEAQVLVVKKRPDVVTGENRQMTQLDDYLASQRAIIQSPLIVERAIAQSKLNDLRSLGGTNGDLAEAILRKLYVDRLKDKDTPVNANSILSISFSGSVADECGTVVNAVLDSYKSFLDETYRNMSTDTIHIITEARDVLENDLAKKEAAYRDFRRASPMIWKKNMEINPYQERVAQIESQRSALLLRQAELEGQLRTLEDAREAGCSQEELEGLVTMASSKEDAAPPDRNTPSLKGQLVPLLHEERALLEYFGPNHPQVLSVRQRIEATRKLFAVYLTTPEKPGDKATDSPPRDLPAIYLQYLRRERDRLKTSEAILASLSEREQKTAQELNSYEIEDAGFRNGIARTQLLYDGLVKRLQEASLVKDYGGFEARVIDPAGPGKKIFPNPVFVLTGAAFLGLLLGAGLVGAVEIRGAWLCSDGRRNPDILGSAGNGSGRSAGRRNDVVDGFPMCSK